MVQILSETITHYELRIDIIKRVKTGKVKSTLPVIDGGSIPLTYYVTYFKIKRVKTGKVKSTLPVIDGGSIPPAMVPLTGLEPV